MSDLAPPIDRTDERLDALRELRQMGMTVARAVTRLAEEAVAALDEAAPDNPSAAKDRPAARAGELSLAFARVSRAVRLTVALEERMEAGKLAPLRAAAEIAQCEAQTAAIGRNIRAVANAHQLAETVNDLIEDAAGEDEAAAERLYDALQERLDELEEGDLADRPVVELVAVICRDLGLQPDWDLWADDDWIEEAGGLHAVKRIWAQAAAGGSAAVVAPEPVREVRPP